MLDLRKRIFIAVSLLIAVVLAFGLLLKVFRQKNYQAQDQQVQQTDSSTINEKEQVKVAPSGGTIQKVVKVEEKSDTPATQPTSEEIYVKQISGIFIERFLTYSNQNNNSHLIDAKALATEEMGKWVDEQKVMKTGGYYAITTEVIASKVLERNDSQATVEVSAQQVIEENGKESTNQLSGKVYLVKKDNEWKISGLYWD